MLVRKENDVTLYHVIVIVCHVTRAAIHMQNLRLHARARESTCMHAVLRVALDLLKYNR